MTASLRLSGPARESLLVRSEGLNQIYLVMTRRCCSLPSLLLLVAACGSGGSSDNSDGGGLGGRTAEDGAGCNAVSSVNLAWSERSTLGFSADELLNALGAEHQARLTYADGTSTTLTLGLQRGTSGQVQFQQRQYTSDQSGRELAVDSDCDDVLSIPVTLSFTTNDGAFAESWALSLLADSATTATGYVPLELDALAGSYTVTEVDPAEFDDVVAFITLGFAAAAWSGSVSGQAIQSDAAPSGTSSARSFSIGSF
jgi:hypothetical protein